MSMSKGDKFVCVMGSIVLVCIFVAIGVSWLTPIPPVEATPAAAQTQNLAVSSAKLRAQAEVLTNKWPMLPPKVEIMSDWSEDYYGKPQDWQGPPYFRHIRVCGRLILESNRGQFLPDPEDIWDIW